MTLALINAMMGDESTVCSITCDLVNVSSDISEEVVLKGEPYSAKLVAAAGYGELTVSVIMGDRDITSSVWNDGMIRIPRVTGDVVITATAAIDDTPNVFRWEMGAQDLICTEDTNVLIRKAGTVTDGVINNAYYRLEEPVILLHDQPWIIEWSASGMWGGMIFSTKENSSAKGNQFLFKTTTDSGLIGFGEPVGSTYENYGVALAAQGVDTVGQHVYRIENRISADGSNQAHLFVDDISYGPMNHFFIGGNNDQGRTVNWLNGRDFIFYYIGSSGHTIKNCKLDYLAVWEGGKSVEHIYADHLNTLPDQVCMGLNLWPLLEHDPQYYTANGWGVHESNQVFSVTIPVTEGDKIAATSFGSYPSNGNTINTGSGIRVTFFGENCVIRTMSADAVYTEFSANGYLTAPEGTTAVNIPMWNQSDDNELYLLDRAHYFTDYSDYDPEAGAAVAACNNGCGATDRRVIHAAPQWEWSAAELTGEDYGTGRALLALFDEHHQMLAADFCSSTAFTTVGDTVIFRYAPPEFSGEVLEKTAYVIRFSLDLTDSFAPILQAKTFD